jgi:hypothetical protein
LDIFRRTTACVSYGGRGEVHTGILWGEPREGDRLEKLDVDWKIILKWIFKKWYGSMD